MRKQQSLEGEVGGDEEAEKVDGVIRLNWEILVVAEGINRKKKVERGSFDVIHLLDYSLVRLWMAPL